MQEKMKVKAKVLNIQKKANFDLIEVFTDLGETTNISNWNKIPLKVNGNYILEIKENHGYYNLISATTEDGKKVV